MFRLRLRRLIFNGLRLFFTVVVALVGGCKRSATPVVATEPPTVTVAYPLQRQVMQWDQYSGWLEAVESVDVMSRVSGYLQAAPFQEGSLVNKGDLLYEIDPRPYQAALSQAQAEVLAAQARQAYAANEFRRLDDLRHSDAVSELELENARQSLRETDANVEAAQARTEAARLNVEFCRVTAPIAGRIGRKLVTPGNLVNGGAGQATLLTTIESIDPIYCYVEVDESSVLKYQRLSIQNKRVSARDSRIVCFIGLSNEQGFPHEGFIDFVDNRIDPQTGTLEGRGVFSNPTGFLTPGLFARVRIPGSGRYSTLLIPDSAVGADQNHKFVLVVKSDNTVESRPVQLGHLFGELRSIEKGITAEDRVIINGLQRARAGSTVKAQMGTIVDSLDESVTTLPLAATTQPTTAPATPGAWTATTETAQ